MLSNRTSFMLKIYISGYDFSKKNWGSPLFSEIVNCEYNLVLILKLFMLACSDTY